MNDDKGANIVLQADHSNLGEWLAVRREVGLKIDPATAEVSFHWTDTGDPYGIHARSPGEDYCVGRSYFARSPGSDIWVEFGDLPDETRDKLWNKIDSGVLGPRAGFLMGKDGKMSWQDGV
jgi:hypothetical protein